MSNEAMQNEQIIRLKSDVPKAKQISKPKAVKVTERTHKSLMSKIKDDIKESFGELKDGIKQSRLRRAFDRYNRRYAKVEKNTEVAEETGKASDYADVIKYDRRLARYAVRLLKDEIKAGTEEVELTAKQIRSIEKARRLKVPKFLVDKITEIGQKIEGFKQRRKTKKATKEYIKDSLRGALYTKEGLLQEEIDKKVIANLGVETKEGYSNESLRGFVSKDGKTPLFKEEADDELTKPTKTGSNTPPTAPSATSEPSDKSEKATTIAGQIIESLKKARAEAATPAKEVGESSSTPAEEQTEVSEDDKTTPVKGQEVLQIFEKYTERINGAKTEEEVAQIKKELAKELAKQVSSKESHVGGKSKKAKPKTEETASIEPIEITPKEEKKESEVKINPTPKRVTGNSQGTPLKVTFEDIKKLQSTLEAAKAEVAENKATIEKLTSSVNELSEQKRQLEQMREEYAGIISQRAATGQQVAELSATEASLSADVSGLYHELGMKK